MKKTNHSYRMRVVALLVLTAVAATTFAQQIPLLSTYSFNKFLVNPAFTGIDNEYRVFGLYRSQWGGMPGRPVTGGATVEGSFWKDRIGTGLFILHDQVGIFQQTQVNLSYAQKIKFAVHHQIAIGIQGGIVNNNINFANANAKDANDPGLLGQRANRFAFDISAGISYKWKDLVIGVSMPRIIETKNIYTEGDTLSSRYKYVRHFTMFAQYRIAISKGKFGITPTLFMRKSAGSGYQFDATALFDYKKMFFIGGGYRNSFGIIGMAGVNLFDIVTVAYAYDAATGKVMKGNVGATHEVTFGIHIGSDHKRKKKEEQAKLVSPDTTTSAALLQQLQKTNDSLSNDLNSSKEMLGTLSQEKSELEQDNKALTGKVDSLNKALSSLDQTLAMQSITDVKNSKESTFTLDKIFFEYRKSELLPDSRSQLDSLAGFLKRFPGVEIEVRGYTDNTGTDEANRKLSAERAKAVADYLVSQGINTSRLTYKGMGSDNPVANNNTEQGRSQNRRVEFSITKK